MRPLFLDPGGGVCGLEPDCDSDRESKLDKSVWAYEAPTTIPESLVFEDAFLEAEGRLRQNGEVFLSDPSRSRIFPGQLLKVA